MLVAVGLDRNEASLADREAVALPPETQEEALTSFSALDGVDELFVLSTCYRVELYVASRCPAAAKLSLRRALSQRARRDLPLFELADEEAFRHLARVAASLESAAAGEPEILGQVEEALAAATEAGAAGDELAAWTGRALGVARRVRAETAIGRVEVSWGNAVATLAEKVLGPLAGRRAVVLGAGERARLSALHLGERGARVVLLDPAHAQAELEEELAEADLLVSSAPSAPGALAPERIARLVRSRRRGLVLVDLAVPHGIPPAVGSVEDVYLCDMDDLERLFKASLTERAAAVAAAERIVEEEVTRLSCDGAERRQRKAG